MSLNILVLSTAKKGQGSGHIRRSSRLVQELRSLGHQAYVYVGEADVHKKGRNIEELAELAGLDSGLASSIFIEDIDTEENWSFALFDCFRTEPALFKKLAKKKIALIGLDEGGRHRKDFDWLIDIIPNPCTKIPANQELYHLSVAHLKPRPFAPTLFTEQKKILITFGGEDTAGSSFFALKAVKKLPKELNVSVEVLIPPSMPAKKAQALKAEVLRQGHIICPPTSKLADRLASNAAGYTLVITQFGLTMLEALRSGLPVWTISPTKTHKNLCRALGLPGKETGFTLNSEQALENILQRSQAVASKIFAQTPTDSEPKSLAELLVAYSMIESVRCPLCRQIPRGNILARFPDRSYRRCAHCRGVSMFRTGEIPIVYDKNYFFDDYKKQYGKTYLEDFKNIQKMSAQRLEIIEKYLKNPARVLDIGCAYGPFLAEAQRRGFKTYGIDASKEAVAWVNKNLNIPAVAGLFPHVDLCASFGQDSFRLVSLWFLIEHIDNVHEFMLALANTVESGGILAFSSPSFAGISAIKNRQQFLQHSPKDHWTVLEPKNMRRLLAKYGFKLLKIRITGHHPERFPGIGKIGPQSLLWKIVLFFSKLCKLGDSFEVYARKR